MADEDLERVAFRRLDEESFATIRHAGQRRRYADGDTLLSAGDTDFRFFAIESGRVAIYEGPPTDDRLVTVHEAGEFTGDVDVLTGKPSIVTAMAQGDCVVYELTPDAVRQLIRQVPSLGDLLLEAFVARRRLLEDADSHAVRVIGSRFSPETTRIRQFLSRNGIPHTWVDTETDPDVDAVLRAIRIDESETPVVESPGFLLRNPTNEDLASALGIRTPVEAHLYDLVIVGAGPTGLAAAVYAASEGLDTVVLEQTAPGGQAGCSSRIENYLGFPGGVSGAELTQKALAQAYKFGAKISTPSRVTGVDVSNPRFEVHLHNGEHLWGRSLLIASGAEYRRLDVPERERYDGAGVYYSATETEAPLCEGKDAIIVGGGNSGGQAALYLATRARRVFIVCRGEDLGDTMSRYLVRRIQSTPNITVMMNSEITALSGDSQLECVEVCDRARNTCETVTTSTVFSMIGAIPRTEWLPAEFARDARGFVLTGPDLARAGARSGSHAALLETSVAGAFAAGDVRAGSSKRVAAAVGEGSMAVQYVHRHLASR